MSLSLPVLDKILINHLLEVEKKYFTTITTELDRIHLRLDMIEKKQIEINRQLKVQNINMNDHPPGLERIIPKPQSNSKIKPKQVKQKGWQTVSYKKKSK